MEEEQSQSEKEVLARDQPVGDKPEGTSDADYQEFQERRRKEQSQIDKAEGRADNK